MIDIKGLTKRYEDGAIALDHVTYSIQPGEVFCLLGANGAGKTTTINILLDFIQPTEGHCYINGHDCNERPLEAKKYVSYVSENVQLYGMFTARQNLRFFAELGGKKGLKNHELDDAMRTVGLPEKALTMRLKNFSKGMRQKVGIAIALAKKAEALLLDEPTSGLDPKASNEFSGLLQKMSSEGVAIFMTTHDLFRAKETGTRVGIMKQGRLVDTFDTEGLQLTDLERIYLEHMHD